MNDTTNVVVSKCWNKPNVTSRRASTLGRLAIFALRDEVTRVIIVVFVGGKLMLQMESKQAAHHRISRSQECRRLLLLCSFSRRLVVCAASLARRLIDAYQTKRRKRSLMMTSRSFFGR